MRSCNWLIDGQVQASARLRCFNFNVRGCVAAVHVAATSNVCDCNNYHHAQRQLQWLLLLGDDYNCYYYMHDALLQ